MQSIIKIINKIAYILCFFHQAFGIGVYFTLVALSPFKCLVTKCGWWLLYWTLQASTLQNCESICLMSDFPSRRKLPEAMACVHLHRHSGPTARHRPRHPGGDQLAFADWHPRHPA